MAKAETMSAFRWRAVCLADSDSMSSAKQLSPAAIKVLLERVKKGSSYTDLRATRRISIKASQFDGLPTSPWPVPLSQLKKAGFDVQ